MLGLLKQIGWQPSITSPQTSKYKEAMLKKISRLSKKECDCLQLLIQGKTAKDTANLWSISPRTVEYYFENIKDKLGCINKRELYAFALFMHRSNLL